MAHSFGIYTNPLKDEGLIITRRVTEILDKKGVSYCIDDQIMGDLGGEACSVTRPDVLIVIGGDGTMLSAARAYAEFGTLLWGINLGRLGFLLETEISEIETAIDRILSDDFHVEKRIMLDAAVIDEDGSERIKALALNETVVSQRRILRMINIGISINGELTDDLFCDGVIIATPTGSTGYSMSAGGPVVTPTLEAMLITPVCPHSLRAQNLVVSASDVIRIWPQPGTKYVAMTIDGHHTIPVKCGEHVRVRAAGFAAKFIRFSEPNFFVLLKDKLSEWNTIK